MHFRPVTSSSCFAVWLLPAPMYPIKKMRIVLISEWGHETLNGPLESLLNYRQASRDQRQKECP